MRRVVDLTMPIHEGMTTFPSENHPRVEISQLGRHGLDGRETRKIVMGTHTGTHVDAPLHFFSGGGTIDDVDLEQLCGPAAIAVLSSPCDISQLDEVLKRRAERLVLRSDWSDYLDTNNYYNHYPYLIGPVVQRIIASGCRVLAMDMPSPDKPGDPIMPAHKVLMDAGIILVESLVNLRYIRSPVFELVVAPLKIRGGDGAPARVFAIERD